MASTTTRDYTKMETNSISSAHKFASKFYSIPDVFSGWYLEKIIWFDNFHIYYRYTKNLANGWALFKWCSKPNLKIIQSI